MTCMRARRSSKFSQIGPPTAELAALERLKKIPGCLFYPILFILAGNDEMHESSGEFEIRPEPTTGCGVSCP